MLQVSVIRRPLYELGELIFMPGFSGLFNVIMKRLVSLIVYGLLISSCGQRIQEEGVDILPIKVDDRSEEILMSTLVDTVRVIALDNTELVGSVDEILWPTERIIILDSKRTKKVFIFDSKGTLVRSIDSGSGEPGKFVWPYAPTLSFKGDSFYIISDRTKMILEYDLDGSLLNEFNISELGQVNDMIALENGFAFSTKPDSQSGVNIIFTDPQFNPISDIRTGDFYDEPLFISGGATNSFYSTEETGRFFYKDLMSNKLLEIRNKKVVDVLNIDLPDSYEVDYSKIGRSMPDVLEAARSQGLVKLNDNHVNFGKFMIIDLSNSGIGTIGILDKENLRLKFVSNLKNDLSILIDLGAVWGPYNNTQGKLVTSIEAPIMTRILGTVDYSGSPYAPIFDNLLVESDDNPVLIVYELKRDYHWPFD